MKKVLLVNPNYYSIIFKNSKAKMALSRGIVPLGLSSVAAALRKDGNEVRIADLNNSDEPASTLITRLKEFQPDFVGFTVTTPMFPEIKEMAQLVKEYDKNITILAGGPHVTAVPEEVLETSAVDIAVCGEGDIVAPLIAKNPSLEGMAGVRPVSGKFVIDAIEEYRVADVDSLPFPALDLLDVSRYIHPYLVSRNNPVCNLETSRGCPFGCVFCNKNITGFKFRAKSPARVVDEMQYMLGLGFKEIQIIDDGFTTDIARTTQICEEILKRNLKFTWYPRGGVRVDRINLDLLKLMKKAGCYRTPFGVESGSERILKNIKKGIKIEQARNAVRDAKKAGMETECYFMIGLPGETTADIEKSIKLAIELNPDFAKFAITVPLPGTEMFKAMEEKGQLITKDWAKYNFATPEQIYTHESLDWATINRYYRTAHIRFYFRPKYAAGMLIKSIQRGMFFHYLYAFLKTKWL